MYTIPYNRGLTIQCVCICPYIYIKKLLNENTFSILNYIHACQKVLVQFSDILGFFLK